MRQNVQEFATSLLDHTRTSHELEVMLNYNPLPGFDVWEPGDRQSLERLKLAISYKQKQVRFISELQLISIKTDFFIRTVCSPSKCTTIACIAMVRWIARFSTQKYDRSIDSSGSSWLYVSRVQYDLYIRTKFGKGKIHEKTVRQIHHSFDQLFDIFKFVSSAAEFVIVRRIQQN